MCPDGLAYDHSWTTGDLPALLYRNRTMFTRTNYDLTPETWSNNCAPFSRVA